MISLTLFELEIPLRIAFSHHQATHTHTRSIIVRAERAGIVGFGEGCPRQYVTGENIASCRRFFDRWARELGRGLVSVDELRGWVTRNREEIDRAPAAFCAIELALLDLFGKEEELSVEALLALPVLQSLQRFSAVVGNQPPHAFESTIARYLNAGFDTFKIKLAGDPESDRHKCRVLRAAGINKVRADANNLWPSASRALAYLRSLPLHFQAIEEPLTRTGFPALGQLASTLASPVVLDENLTRLAQLDRIRADAGCYWLNLRISKLGGLLRSVELADAAVALGFPIVIGAQVGETSLLSRAALALGEHCSTALQAREGAFGTQLLREDIATPEVRFGQGGRLQTAAFAGKHGLGLTVLSSRLDRFARALSRTH